MNFGEKLFWECQCISKASEIPLWPYWGVESEIVVFLINGDSNQECCQGNKIFHILEFLLSCFISVPSFTLFWLVTSEQYLTQALNIAAINVIPPSPGTIVVYKNPPPEQNKEVKGPTPGT